MTEVRHYDSDLVGLYTGDIRDAKIELLNKEKEIELSKTIEAGLYAKHLLETGEIGDYDPAELADAAKAAEEAVELFIVSNLRLVLDVAKNYSFRTTSTMDYSDVIQEGNLGLQRAVWGFDYKKGFKFSTYATWWIRESIGRAMHEKARSLRVPTYIEENLNKIRNAQREFLIKNDREATMEELLQDETLGLTEKEIKTALTYRRDAVSLNMPVGDGESELGDYIHGESDFFEEKIDSTFLGSRLREALEGLGPRDQTIMMLRFGMTGEEPMSMEAVGKEVGLSRERVRQLEIRSLAKLREFYPELAEYL